jgi:hypothetical protein
MERTQENNVTNFLSTTPANWEEPGAVNSKMAPMLLVFIQASSASFSPELSKRIFGFPEINFLNGAFHDLRGHIIGHALPSFLSFSV